MRKILCICVLAFIIGNLNAADTSVKRSVKISYNLKKSNKIAGNQIAVWIEDQSGNMIKTVFVTRFTASVGYLKRGQALAEWVKKFDIKNKQKSEIDAVSGATPRSGVVTHIWDCTDSSGNPVKDGKYNYIIESNVFWENMVYARGVITVGNVPDRSVGDIEYKPAGATVNGTIIGDVTAVFE